MATSSQDHVDSDGSHSDDGNDASDSPSIRSMTNVRGAALLKKVRRLSCQGTKKIPVKLDTHGKPINLHSILFENYVGYLARDRVSIKYKNWKEVPKKTKVAIYNHLMITFDINPQKMTKKMILANIGNKWRTFKVNLGKLMKDKKTGKYLVEPPKFYQYIDKDAWTAFVKHHSSMGYARLQEKMLTLLNLDPEIDSLSRADLWKAARCDEDGNFNDVETSKIVKKKL